MNSDRRMDAVWFLFGAIVGWIFTMLIVILTPSDWDWSKILKDYGDLIGGILAIVGGSLAVWKINDQIAQIERHKEEDRRRSEYATRAVLSHALRLVSDCAQKSLDILIDIHDGTPDKPQYDHYTLPIGLSIEAPGVPNNSIEMLQKNIEVANESARSRMFQIIKELQWQNSRLVSAIAELHGRPGYIAEHWLETLMRDAIKIYALTAPLFLYARCDPDYRDADLTVEDIQGSVRTQYGD